MKIQFVNGPLAGTVHTLQPPGVSIGREEDNDIQLLVAGVSRYHAKIAFDGAVWTLSDVGSTNGTKLNQDLISAAVPLKPGDLIALGDQIILFGPGQQPSAADALSRTASFEKPVPEVKKSVRPDSSALSSPSVRLRTASPVSVSPPDSIPSPDSLSSPEAIRVTPDFFRPQSAKEVNPLPSGKPASSDGPVLPPLESTGTSKKGPPVTLDGISPDKPLCSDPAEKNSKGSDSSRPILSNNIFGGKKKSSSSDSSSSGSAEPEQKKRKMGNVIFYLLVFWAVLVLLFLFVSMNKEKKNTETAGPARKPEQSFALSYEKKKIEPDNVFRFALELDGNAAEFVIDDLKYERHFRKRIDRLEEKYLKELKNAVLENNFLALKVEHDNSSVGKVDTSNRLTVVLDGKVHSVLIRNSYPPTSFEQVEKAIADFAERFNIRTVSMTVEEMRTEAKKAFEKAEQLFKNREGNARNLREAISRYRLTMDYLEQFSPKPEEWTIARDRIKEGEKIFDKKISDLNFAIQQALRLKEYDKGSRYCQEVMDMTDEDSKIYRNSRDAKLKFDQFRRMQK